jgi:hypothetical protein
MTKAGRSVAAFGIYLIFLGITLTVVPNRLLALFSLPSTSDVWIRVVGMLVLCLAYYYIQAARLGLSEFFRWTVYARGFVFLALGTFAALQLARPPLALFGVVDLLGAIWTSVALRQPPNTYSM